MSEPSRRRRRIRHGPEAPPAPGPASPGPRSAGSEATRATGEDGAPSAPEPARAERAQRVAVPEVADEPADAEPSPVERGLRGLVGGGSSQVSPAAALRARDAARPLDEHIAAAERDLVIVRRHWSPRT